MTAQVFAAFALGVFVGNFIGLAYAVLMRWANERAAAEMGRAK